MAKREKGKRPARPSGGQGQGQQAKSVEAPEEIRGAVAAIQTVVREAPGGWSTVAEVLKQEEVDPDAILEFLARSMGKETLPLLRGLALDDDDDLAESALKALPLLGTRAAGDTLVEAYKAHSEGERARLAWLGVEALQARGINVTVPAPEETRAASPKYSIRETWETVTDGVGTREIIARVQDRYGVWHSVVVIWNDRAGIKDSMMGPLSQREWREMLHDHAREEIQIAQTPPDFVRLQVANARALNEKTGLEIGEKLANWETHIGPLEGDYAAPDPLAPVQALSAEERAALIEDPGPLFDMPAFRTWAIEPADCKPWWEEWNEIDEDAEEDAQIEAADAILAKVADAVIDPETVALYRARLVDSAIKLRFLKREREALISAALALELDEGKSPGQIKLFRYLAGNGLEMLGDILEDGDDPEELRYDPMGSEELAQPSL